MSDLPWSEDYMLRMSHPMYNAFCREDEGASDEWLPCRDDDYEDDDDRRRRERDAAEHNNLMKGDK